MAPTAARNVSTEPKNRSTGRQSKSKSYRTPTLVKAAILSAVTANNTSISGVTQDR
jgi:hypothetical protein